MACPARSDHLFGPRVNAFCRSLDFTLLFEDSILGCLPAACLLLCAVPPLLNQARRFKGTSHRSKSILIAKLIIWAAILITQIIFAAFRNENDRLTTKASTASDVLNIVASIVAVLLSFVSHQASPRPSTPLVLYLSTQTLLLLPRLRTIWMISPKSSAAASITALYIVTVASLVAESVEEKPSQTKESPSSKEPYLGFWNRTSFAWMLDIFRLGNISIISQSDLPALDPQLQSHLLRDRLLVEWKPETRQKHRSLFYATMKLLRPLLVSTVIPRLCETVFTFAQPFMINTTVKYIAQLDASPDYGKGLIGAWALVYLGLAISHSTFQYKMNRIMSTARGALLAVIHEHSMRTRAADSGEITAVALMGTDVQRIANGLHFLGDVWAAILDIAIACWLLERQLSLACLAPIMLTLLFIAITSVVSSKAGDLQRKWTERVQERLKVTSALLSDMKAVKMLGIAPIMSGIVARLRKRELDTSKGYRKVLTSVVLLSLSPINLSPIVTFGIYIVIAKFWKDETLLTAQAFTAVSLITLLTSPVISFIQGLPQFLQSFSGYDRIQEYCNYSNSENYSNHEDGILLSPEAKSSVPLNAIVSQDEPVRVIGSRFSWDKTSSPVLHDINLVFAHAKVTGIAGAVGSGKSALLNAIIGEMYSETPPALAERTGPRPMAYCAQEPWLENGTIGANITGPLPFSQSWYDKVKWSCGLDEDIKVMPSGDDTKIGTNGYSLSGGQKQRAALARAAYAKEKVVVLDDAFSGMDAKTTLKVGSRLFGKDGLFRESGTTVIIATHSAKILSLTDNTVVLEEGKVVEQGPTKQLLHSSSYLNKSGVVSTTSEEKNDVDEMQNTQPEATASLAPTKGDIDHHAQDLRRNTGDLRVYGYYIKSGGYMSIIIYAISVTIWTFGTEGSTIWVKQWAEANEKRPNQNAGYYLGIYAVIGVVSVAGACLAAWSVILPLVTNSARSLHADLLQTTFRAPFRFFTKTDSGELLNRFSQDMELVDMELPIQMINYTSGLCTCVARLVVVAIFSKYLGITAPVFIFILYFIQRFYLRTSRQLRLLTIEASAPLYTHFTESVAGIATIRAFRWERYYEERCLQLNDNSRRPQYLLANLQTCLTFGLEVLMTVMVIVLAAIVISLRDKFSAGSVGVSLVMVVGFGETLVRLIASWTALETCIGAVARVRRFVLDTPNESITSYDMPVNWPHSGKVEFKNVTVSYEPQGDTVLRNVHFSIASGERVAICGRTGSGKSSLIASILCMTSIEEGNILIDDLELPKLAPDDIRPRINAVPQDPFLFPGTMRRNIDPFGEATDEAIQKALDQVRLWDTAETQGGLDKEIDTEAWSAGQKQLLCFARAMVRNSRVLVLDEAASNVDAETEELIQDLIDTQFKGCTVISVMHRLKHVTRYDKVAVMDAGQLVEFDAPEVLLAGDSKFAEMFRSAK